VLEAFAWSVFAASSLLIGAWLARARAPSDRTLGLIMAFGAGALISSVAFELIEKAFIRAGGTGAVIAGFFVGALAFYVGDRLIRRAGGGNRKSTTRADGDSAKAIALGTVLDGIPESVVIGMTLLGGGGVGAAIVAGVFVSNLPEAMAASSSLSRTGVAWPRIMAMWLVIVLASGLAAAVGFVALADANRAVGAFILAFAGGAILTMLASTMMPEAYKHGGEIVGIVTALGFAAAFAIGTL
jgi:ZIP family zinc transporter